MASRRPDDDPRDDIDDAHGLTPLRELPHDLAAEAALVGAAMLGVFDIDGVLPGDFFSERHRRVYEAILTLRAAGTPIDEVNIGTQLRNMNRLEQVGGFGALTELLTACPAVAHARSYAETVRSKAHSRRAISAGQKLAAQAYAGHDPAGLVAEAIADLGKLSAGSGTAQAPPWLACVDEVPTDWYATAPPNRAWLLRDRRHPKGRGVLPLGKVGQLIAEGGAGKTMALCQLAVSVATGVPFLGAFDVPEPGRVLLVLGEEDAEESRRRLYQAARASHARAPDPSAIVVLSLAGHVAPMLALDLAGNLTETDFLSWIRDYVRACDFRLVAVDPLSRFAGPEAETDNASATRFIQALESIVIPTCTLLNAHHTNKVSRGPNGKLDASSGRGSSAFVDGARWQASLSVEYLRLDSPEVQERLGEIVTFAVTKSNYAAKPDPVLLRRDGDSGALVAVEADDMATVDAARSGAAARAAKSHQREAEREQNRETRAQRDDARRAVREAQAQSTEAERRAREDAALGAILSSQVPPTSKRALRAALAAALGSCSHDRADDAIARHHARGGT